MGSKKTSLTMLLRLGESAHEFAQHFCCDAILIATGLHERVAQFLLDSNSHSGVFRWHGRKVTYGYTFVYPDCVTYVSRLARSSARGW